MKLRIVAGWHIITILLFSIGAHSQPVLKGWDKTIKANQYDGSLFQMIKAGNDQLLISCQTFSDSSYDKTCQYNGSGNIGGNWVLMNDFNGNKIWDRDFDCGGYPRSIIRSGINSFSMLFLTGSFGICGDVTVPSTPGSAPALGCWVVSVDSTGAIFWNNRFNAGVDTTNGVNGFVPANEIVFTNGELYVTGTAWNSPNFVGGDLAAVNCQSFTHLNSDILIYNTAIGDTIKYQWQALFGGDTMDGGFTTLPLSSGEFLIGGVTSSLSSCDQTVSTNFAGYTDYLVIKTDSIGNTIWQKNYGGSKDDWLSGILDLGNSEYLLYGHTLSPQGFDVSSAGYNDTSLWLVKIDSLGNKIWDKRFGGCSGEFIWFINQFGLNQNPMQGYLRIQTISALKTADNGVLIVTSVKDSLACGDVSENGNGHDDYWALKLDSAGNKLWDKRLGGPGRDIAQEVVETFPGHYVIGGVSIGYDSLMRIPGGDKSDVTIGLGDIWLIEIKDKSLINYMPEINNTSIQIYPNPSHDFCNIKMSKNGLYKLKLYDLQGRSILEDKFTSELKLQIKDIRDGTYIINISDYDFSINRKFVKYSY